MSMSIYCCKWCDKCMSHRTISVTRLTLPLSFLLLSLLYCCYWFQCFNIYIYIFSFSFIVHHFCVVVAFFVLYFIYTVCDKNVGVRVILISHAITNDKNRIHLANAAYVLYIAQLCSIEYNQITFFYSTNASRFTTRLDKTAYEMINVAIENFTKINIFRQFISEL